MAKSMQKKPFTAKSLLEVDSGSVALAIDKEIKRAFMDMADRPEIKKPRKIALTIEMSPIQKDGGFYQSLVKIDVDGRNPKRGIEIRMNAESDGLEYNSAVYENPNQTTMNLEEE